MNPDSARVDSVAEAIEAYLVEHPDAADSVEGITTWWMQRQRYRTAVTQVEQALRQLEERGVVQRSTSRTGAVVYRAVRHGGGDKSDDENSQGQ